MNFIKTLWHIWIRKSSSLSRWVIIPAVCYLELLFHLWIGGAFTPEITGTLLGFALCLGGLLNLPAVLLPGKASRWFAGIVIFLFTTVMMVEMIDQ